MLQIIASCFCLFSINGVYSKAHITGSSKMSYDDAQAYCLRQGSNLASISSILDQQDAENVCPASIGREGCWFGLNDKANEGSFSFVDGTPFDAINSYNNWGDDEPNGGTSENCIELSYGKNFEWNDFNCSVLLFPLCNPVECESDEDCAAGLVCCNDTRRFCHPPTDCIIPTTATPTTTAPSTINSSSTTTTTNSSSTTTTIKTSSDSLVKSEIKIEGVLLFVVVIFLVKDVILIGICLYYIGTKLRRRIMQPHNVSWLQAIKQFQLFHFISIALELFDIITDYVFSVGLILSDSYDMVLVTLGWIALIVSVIGLILFFIKYMVIRKLYLKQIASLRESLKRTATDEQRDSIMEQIRSRIMDVDMLSLLNACVEDIPQIVIVLIVFSNFGIDAASILCITGSMLSFGMKVAGIIMGKCGCKDVTEEFDPTLETENVVLTEQSGIAACIAPELEEPTVIYNNRVQQPVQPTYSTHYM